MAPVQRTVGYPRAGTRQLVHPAHEQTRRETTHTVHARLTAPCDSDSRFEESMMQHTLLGDVAAVNDRVRVSAHVNLLDINKVTVAHFQMSSENEGYQQIGHLVLSEITYSASITDIGRGYLSFGPQVFDFDRFIRMFRPRRAPYWTSAVDPLCTQYTADAALILGLPHTPLPTSVARNTSLSA